MIITNLSRDIFGEKPDSRIQGFLLFIFTNRFKHFGPGELGVCLKYKDQYKSWLIVLPITDQKDLIEDLEFIYKNNYLVDAFEFTKFETCINTHLGEAENFIF